MKKRNWWTGYHAWLAGPIVAAMIALVIAGGCVREEEEEVLIRYYSAWSHSAVVSANGDWAAGGGSAALVKMNESRGFPVKDQTAALSADIGGIDITGAFGGQRAYIVGRDIDSVFVLDLDQDGALLDTFTVGPASWPDSAYPQDVLVISREKAYVTRQGQDDILIIDPESGERKGNITFSAVGGLNDDGLARPADMIMKQDTVYVALQNLDAGWGTGDTVIGNGIIAVVDPYTDSVGDTITLSRYNPYRLLYSAPNDAIFIACAGRFGDAPWGEPSFPHPEESGLEVVSAAPPYTHHLIASGDASFIGGNISDVALDGRGSAWLLVATNGFDPPDKLVKLDVYTSTFLGTYPDPLVGTERFAGIVSTPEGFIVVGDRANKELLIMDSLTDAAIGNVPLSLAPLSLAVAE